MSRGKNTEKAPSMPGTYLSLGGTERETVGVIVTAREQLSDERRSFYQGGTVRGAIEHIVSELDALPGDWRVLSVSTPATIFRDLQGTRDNVWTDETNTPERKLLSRIGRRDMLDPSHTPRVGGREQLIEMRRERPDDV